MDWIAGAALAAMVIGLKLGVVITAKWVAMMSL
jgi:hypothetical protein